MPHPAPLLKLPADVLINFASMRSAFESSLEALRQPTIRVVAVIAEGVPERDTKQVLSVLSWGEMEGAEGWWRSLRRVHLDPGPVFSSLLLLQLIAYAKENHKVIIGPATVGGVQARRHGAGWLAGRGEGLVVQVLPVSVAVLETGGELLGTRLPACLRACPSLPPARG